MAPLTACWGTRKAAASAPSSRPCALSCGARPQRRASCCTSRSAAPASRSSTVTSSTPPASLSHRHPCPRHTPLLFSPLLVSASPHPSKNQKARRRSPPARVCTRDTWPSASTAVATMVPWCRCPPPPPLPCARLPSRPLPRRDGVASRGLPRADAGVRGDRAPRTRILAPMLPTHHTHTHTRALSPLARVLGVKRCARARCRSVSAASMRP